MSYQITVKNNYREAVNAFGSVLNMNETQKINKTFGHGSIEVFGLGRINFTDIGDKSVGGNSKGTWGVLISYQGEELVFRYEGGGQINLRINEFGQAEFDGNGEFSRIKLDSFVLKKRPGQ